MPPLDAGFYSNKSKLGARNLLPNEPRVGLVILDNLLSGLSSLNVIIPCIEKDHPRSMWQDDPIEIQDGV